MSRLTASNAIICKLDFVDSREISDLAGEFRVRRQNKRLAPRDRKICFGHRILCPYSKYNITVQNNCVRVRDIPGT
jgi:hypothetical protein